MKTYEKELSSTLDNKNNIGDSPFSLSKANSIIVIC
jgi:hypothetical protein